MMQSWWACVAVSTAVSVVTFLGLGGVVHWWFYRVRRDRAAEWKCQPERFLSPQLARHAFILGCANILMGSLAGGTFMWYLVHGGWSMVYFDVHQHGIVYLVVSAVLMYFAIDATLYYSHRLLHNKLVFRYLHRWHHRYVSPNIFTTTAMHPGEFVIFTAMLLVPAFVVPIHAGVYAGVLFYTYLIGMIDHSGIRVRWPLPFHGDSGFHDDHHLYFHCNYGHHTALFDRLHGTVHQRDRYYDEYTFGGKGAELPPSPTPESESKPTKRSTRKSVDSQVKERPLHAD